MESSGMKYKLLGADGKLISQKRWERSREMTNSKYMGDLTARRPSLPVIAPVGTVCRKNIRNTCLTQTNAGQSLNCSPREGICRERKL